MKKWDYKAVKIEKKDPFFDKAYPIAQLQNFGNDGWEVVSIADKFETHYGYGTGTETKNYYWHVLLKKEIE